MKTGTSRRVLHGHDSLKDGGHDVYVGGRKSPMQTFGIDSVALSPDGKWLYYKTLDAGTLHRIRTADLENPALSSKELASRIEKVGDTTMSDGVMMDAQGRLYLSDMEHSAIVRREKDGTLTTLYKDADKLKWPDGFAQHPDGSIYITPSALHEVVFRPKFLVKAKGPYPIYKFKPCK
jgi:sugar lactone lactonase YvrE